MRGQVVMADLPTLDWAAQQGVAAREVPFMPEARYDLTSALSAAIWPGPEVEEVASQPHGLTLLVQVAAGLAALEAHSIVSLI